MHPHHKHGQVANTQHIEVNSINSQKLTAWKADFELKRHYGKTKKEFFARYRGGARPVPEHIKAQYAVTLSTAPQTVPNL
jgi:hypothetical protein